MDAVTEASLLLKVVLKSIITVVDAPHLLELSQGKQWKTFRLMKDQIRCASVLVLNKIDQASSGELYGLEAIIREWNPFASIQGAVYCGIDIHLFDELGDTKWERAPRIEEEGHQELKHNHTHKHEHAHHHHHSHDHVMVYTHYFEQPIVSTAFENMIRELPIEVYRAKGILMFSDTASRYLFQYAYRPTEFIKIVPQGNVPNVAVFIGENFSKEAVKIALEKL
jgi:G3E family GTPase